MTGKVLQEKSFIYNAYDLSIIHFDTEEHVLFWFNYNSKPLAGNKLFFYTSSGAYISTLYTDKAGFCKIANNEYGELFVRVNNSRRLHRISLNRIRKKKYNIFALYRRNGDALRVQGIVSSYQYKTAHLPIEFIIRHNGNPVFTGGVQSDKYGFFGIDIPSVTFTGDSYELVCKVDGKNEQVYNLSVNEMEHRMYTYQDSVSQGIIKPDKTTIFNEDSLTFTIEKLVDKKIENLFYTIEDNNGLKDEQMYRENIQGKILIKLPWETDLSRVYTITFEMIFSDGLSKKEQVVVERHLDFEGHKTIEGSFVQKGVLSIYNPYKSYKALLICYNNDIRYVKPLSLKQGLNHLETISSFRHCTYGIIIKNSSDTSSVTYISRGTQDVKKLSAQSMRKKDIYTVSNVISKAGKFYFVYYTPLSISSNPLYSTYHGYNDCISPENEKKEILEGRLQYINNKNLFLDIPFQQGHKLHISQVSPEGELFDYSAVYLNETIPAIEYQGPVRFSALDKPEQKIVFKNGGIKQEFELAVDFSNFNIKAIKEQLLLNPYETKEISLNLENAPEGELTVKISLAQNSKTVAVSRKSLYVSGSKKVSRIVQLSGKILGNRETGSFIKIHDDSPSYTINLHIGTDQGITALNSSPLTENIEMPIFGIELLSYLEKLVKEQSFRKEVFPAFMEKYYLKNRGISKRAFQKEPDLASTILFLLACKNLPLLQGGAGTAAMLKSLVSIYKKEILEEPFYLFVLSEYGYFFDEISPSYIKSHNNPFYFFNYSKRYKMTPDYSDIKTADAGTGEAEAAHAAGDNLEELLKHYFYMNSEGGLFAGYSLSLYENIMSKVIVLGKQQKDPDGEPVEFVFKSKLLGDFSASLKDNNRLSRSYQCTRYEFSDTKNKLVDFSFEKASANDLFYLIETNYNIGSDLPEKNSAYAISMDLKDQEDKPVSSLVLEGGRSYFLHIDIEKLSTSSGLVLQLPRCWGVSAYKLKTGGETTCLPRSRTKENFILLDNFAPGLHELVLEVQPLVKGTFHITPAVLYDLSNYNNSVQTDAKYISVN